MRDIKVAGALVVSIGKHSFFVMSLDAHGAHIAPCVFEAACRAGVSLMVIPASMTHILQPLDTHVFAKLKLELWRGAQSLGLESDSGEFDIDKFMQMACDVIGRVMSKAFPHAFASCGFSTKQQGLTERVLNALELPNIPEVGSGPPTLHELQLLWPQGKTIPIMSVFRTVLRMRAGHPPVPSLAPAVCFKASPPTPPLRMRLRSASRLQVAEPIGIHPPPPAVRPPTAAASAAPCPKVVPRPESKRSLPPTLPVGRPLLPHRAASRRSLETKMSGG